METGTVKWFNDEKGSGFITPDVAGEDLFVHHEELFGDANSSVAQAAKVSTKPRPEPRVPGALNVRLI